MKTLRTLAAVVLLATTTQAQDELRPYLTGNGLLNRGLYEMAIPEYESFLGDHPEHEKAPTARYGLGVCLYRLKRIDEALPHFESLRDESGFAFGGEVEILIGQCRMSRQEYREASKAFMNLLRDHAGHKSADKAAALLAESRYRAGELERVREPVQLLIDRWPRSDSRERATFFLGLSEMGLGRHAEAARLFEDMRQRFPDGPLSEQASLLRAQSLHRGGGLDEAFREYSRMAQEGGTPYVADALLGMAQVLHARQDLDGAAERLDQLLRQFGDDRLAPTAKLHRGRVHLDAGDTASARRLIQEAARVESLQDDAEYWLAKCDLRDGRAGDAASRLERASMRFPKSELAPEMQYDRAVALYRDGRYDEALEHAMSFRAAHPEHRLAPDALYLLATSSHQMERYERSAAHCDEFLGTLPAHDLAPAVAFLRAENAFLAGDFDGAATRYATFIDEHAESDDASKARFRLGMALHRTGRVDEARGHLEGVTGADMPDVFAGALHALGDGYFTGEQWADAESHLERYVESSPEAEDLDDALIKLGIARHRQGRYEEALQAYDRLLRSSPESEHALHASFERAQALVSLGRTDEAEAGFESLVETSPESRFATHAWRHLGAIALERDEPEIAATYFEQAGEAAGDDVTAGESQYQRARALMDAAKFESALEAFETMLASHPEHDRASQAAAHRAVALARLDRFDDALESIDVIDATDFAGVNADLRHALLYERAWSLRQLGRTDEAIDAYGRLLASGPDASLRSYAMLDLADIRTRGGDYASASTTLVELLDLDPPATVRAQALYRLGVCRFRTDDFKDAASILETYMSENPGSDLLASASLMTGESLLRVGAHREASAHLERVVERFPEDEGYASALLRLGECLSVMQRWGRAHDIFTRHRRTFPDSALWFQSQFGLGWSLENQGRHDEAIEAYRPVVDRHEGPTAARAQFQIGECLYAQKKLDEAARELLKVDILYAYPEWSAAALYEAGRVFLDLRKTAEARTQFTTVVESHPDTDWARLARDQLERLGVRRPD